jgi:hypothetical protein
VENPGPDPKTCALPCKSGWEGAKKEFTKADGLSIIISPVHSVMETN